MDNEDKDPASRKLHSPITRRQLLRTAAGATLGAAFGTPLLAGLARAAGSSRSATRATNAASNAARAAAGGSLLQTVTGIVRGGDVDWTLSHEHFFVDFLGPNDPGYLQVDWDEVRDVCIANAQVLRSQGVNLFVDWTGIGVGRNVTLLREISLATGLHILAPTGIYKSLIPDELANASVDEQATHFFRELTRGIDGTKIRAAWIKIATTESGPTESDTRIHRAAARAGKRAGATISLHSPFTEATNAVVATLESEGFDLRRFIWGHAQPSSVEDHKALAARGATIQYDAISASEDPFFHGPTDDESMLDRIEAMVEAGFGAQVLVSADASVYVNPAIFQYDRDNTYVFGTFAPKLEARLGAEGARMVLRDNVITAFRRRRLPSPI